MKAGRELDALVAEKVMGLPVVWSSEPYVILGGTRREGRFPYLKGRAHGCDYDWAEVPHYSTDIGAALTVAEHMHAQGWHYEVGSHISLDDVRWAEFARGNYDAYDASWEESYDVGAATIPHAICLAALRAVGVEVDA